MKSHTARFSAVLALVLAMGLSSSLAAAPRDTRDRDIPSKVIRIIQKFFGISVQDDPLPPRP